MIPDFHIVVDGSQDVTAAVRERLLSLRVSDEEGYKSDAIEIRLDDRGGTVELPRRGASMTVDLGYFAGGKLAGLDNGSGRVPMGRYTLDEVELSGPQVDQTVESDLHLLTRLADRYDAVAKPGNGRLFFARRGAAMSATLGAVTAVKVAREQAGD